MNKHQRYDTADTAPEDRFAYWSEAVCNSYVQLGCKIGNRNSFNGLIDIHRYSALSISRVSGKAQVVERRKHDIRAANEETYLLSLQTNRSARITQFGKSSLLQVGTWHFTPAPTLTR